MSPQVVLFLLFYSVFWLYIAVKVDIYDFTFSVPLSWLLVNIGIGVGDWVAGGGGAVASHFE